jgi:hypothetical protein
MLRKILLILFLFIGANQLVLGQNKIKELFEQKYQVSLIMPFCSRQILDDPKAKNAPIGNACRQYYEGFSIAMDSFKKADIPIEVRVYDTKRDTNVFMKILAKKEVLNSDLIIGPVLKEGNEMMVDFCNKNNKYHVSPFLTLTKSKIENPYLISAYPDLSYYGDFILENIKNKGDENANVLVVVGKESNDKILANRILALKSKYPNFTIKSIDVSKYTELKDQYKITRSNHIVVACENEFSVGTTLKYLNDSNHFINIQVYGTRKWLEFNTLNIGLCEAAKVKLISPYFFDFKGPNCTFFIEKYRERFFADPQEYAVIGYEQGLYFLNILMKNHGNLSAITKEPMNRPLTNNYLFKIKPEGKSIQNSILNILYFENGELKRE